MKKTTQTLIKPISGKFKLCLCFLLLGGLAWGQTIVSGEVLDADEFPVSNATVHILFNQNKQTISTNNNGKYQFNLPTTTDSAQITFSKEGYIEYQENIKLQPNSTKEIIVKLIQTPSNQVDLQEAVIFQKNQTEPPITSTSVNPESVRLTPSLSGGITDILKTLGPVSVNNELSSQYMVRGGNFDENLIYVNGTEVYRPQLIRSGQQEGLNFVNPSMVQHINFSAGGWESKFGDKLSSVLDIVYKQPTKLEAQLEASLMGGSLTVGGASKNKKTSAIVGARYLNRNLILNTLDGETDFDPTYFDVQANISHKINRRLSIDFLGTISRNSFELVPQTRETDFGSFNNPLRLTVFYDGKEDNQYNAETAALNIHFKPNKKWKLSIGAFAYHSQEQEHYDIAGAYFISEIDPTTGNATQTTDIGGQLDHARNNLDILVGGLQHNGYYKINNNNRLEWGATIQQEDIRDWFKEWQVVDNSGFIQPNQFTLGSVNPNDLELTYSVNARNDIQSNRYSGYFQYVKKFFWNESKILINSGIRATYWDFNQELNVSPRLQIGIKPNWKRDVLFRLAAGMYYQPPFYREIRNLQGQLNNNVKAQQSIHFILGNDYEFKMLGSKTPFKLSTELYYKALNNLNPYFVDNVRIRYAANNDSKGYAWGVDTRLNGEFIPGVESWLSLSYGQAKQNINNRGNIPLPTEPRFKASLFFQDYMDFLPSFKVNVNLIYASGLPNGAPEFQDPYSFTDYLQDYRRVDIGFIKEIINQKDLKPKSNTMWGKVKELSLGLDLFNVFDIRNEVSNTWITNANTNQVFAVPNRLTGRFINARLLLKF